MGISASVGRGGVNHPADVTYVQQLLNQISLSRGGPNPPFMLLGAAGDNLNAAILRFQQANCSGIADGRIDPGGPTIRQLTAMADASDGPPVLDPMSDQPPSFVPGVLDMDVKAKFTLPGFFSAVRSAFPHATPWTFKSSAGVSAGASVVAGAWGFLYLSNSTNTKETPDPTLFFAAVGLGLSASPASGSFSTPSMYSRGIGSIWTSSPVNLKAEDMAGSMLMMSASATPLAPAGSPDGVGLSLYFLNLPNPAMALIKLLEGPSSLYAWFQAGGATQTKAVGMMFGVSKSTPDAGISAIGGWAHLQSAWIL